MRNSEPRLNGPAVISLHLTGLFAFLYLAAFAGISFADDWPQWRGPRRNAISAETGLAHAWPAGGPPVVWQAVGLGTGYSSVVVSHGLIYTIGRFEMDLIATALQAETGKLAWRRKIGSTSRNPCSTPTVDGERVYVLDPDGELSCLNSITGDILWEKRFIEDFGGKMMSGRGYGESPLVDGDALICTPGGPEAGIVALDKRTGATLWKTKIPDIGKGGRDGAGFSSIVMTEVAGVRQYVQLVGRGVVGVSAKEGRFLWGYNAIANDTANIPTPVVRGDLVFVANGYGVGSVLLQVAPEISSAPQGPWKATVIYSLTGSQFQNHHGGVLLIGGHLFGGHGSNNGLPTCLDLMTGRVLWKRRGPGVGSAAVISADGQLYFRYQNGLVALLDATERGYEVTGTLQIPGAGGDSWAHPALANGRLYLREQDVLWTYDVRKESGTTGKPTAAPVVDAAMQELRSLGLSVEQLESPSQKEAPAIPDKSQRLYQYALPANGSDKTERPWIVSISNKEVAETGTISTALLERLKGLNRPLILNLAGTPLSDAGLAQLVELPKIVGLNLELCGRLTDAGLAELAKSKEMRVLILSGTSISATGLKLLIPLGSLTALDLEVCDGVTDAACEPLSRMRQLKALVLKKTGFEKQGITDAGLKHLEQLTRLELLNLYGNRMTDAGLVHLAPLTRLQHLELLYSVGFSGPIITDAGLPALESSVSLKTLNLTGARITDTGLDRLQGLKQLSQLQLVHTSATPAGIKRFQTAVPRCKVVKESIAE